MDPTTVPSCADWHERVVRRSLAAARRRSIDRGAVLVRAAAALLQRSGGDGFTVQDVADEARQSLRTLYQYFESKDDLLLAVFEEAVLTYEAMIRTAVADLDDPMDRLAGALLAALRIPAISDPAGSSVLLRLRLHLTRVEPALVGRAQAPLAALFRELLEAAAAGGGVQVDDLDGATFLVMSLNETSATSTSAADGPRRGPIREVVTFCLRGLGATVDARRLASVERRLRLPSPARPDA